MQIYLSFGGPISGQNRRHYEREKLLESMRALLFQRWNRYQILRKTSRILEVFGHSHIDGEARPTVCLTTIDYAFVKSRNFSGRKADSAGDSIGGTMAPGEGVTANDPELTKPSTT